MDDLRHVTGDDSDELEPTMPEQPADFAWPGELPADEPVAAAHDLELPAEEPVVAAYGDPELPVEEPVAAAYDDLDAPVDEPVVSATDVELPTYGEEPEPSYEEAAELSEDAAEAAEASALSEDGEMEVVPEPEPKPESTLGRLRRQRGGDDRSEIHPGSDRRVKKVVGLKIGASQLAAARIENNGAPELVEVVREPLEPGIVVSGEIRDPDTLAVALRRFFELHKLPKKGVRLGLSNNRIGVRIFEIEGVHDVRQLENAIRFRAEEVLPIPLDEALLDYAVLGEDTNAEGETIKRILLVVAYREVVDRFLQACRGAGLEVVGIDLEAFALLRALAAPADELPGGGALVAVAIGHDRTTIAVSTGRYCEFTRVLDWGGWSLNVAIARELDRAPSEVESVKRQLSFAEDTVIEGLTPEKVTKTREALQRTLSGFTRELVSSLHFYQAQPGALGIGEIVLTGGTAHMPGLADAVGRLIGVPVRLGDPFERVRVGKKVEHVDQHGSLAIAIGLGIED